MTDMKLDQLIPAAAEMFLLLAVSLIMLIDLFLREARRVAPELVLVDASIGHSTVEEEWSPRVLQDGSTWEVYKRWFTPDGLLAEVGGGEALYTGTWFLVVRSRR